MLDFDRRTVLVGSLLTVGGAHPASAADRPENHAIRLLQHRLGKFFGLDDEISWLLTERLKWRNKWPAVVIASGCVSHLSALSERRTCRSTLPEDGMLAIYSGRFQEVTAWRRVPNAEASVLGVHMSSYRSGRQLACLVQPQGKSSPNRIVLEV